MINETAVRNQNPLEKYHQNSIYVSVRTNPSTTHYLSHNPTQQLFTYPL